MKCTIVVAANASEERPLHTAHLGEKEVPFVLIGMEMKVEAHFTIPDKGFSSDVHLIVKRVIWVERSGNICLWCEVGNNNSFSREDIFTALVNEYPLK